MQPKLSHRMMAHAALIGLARLPLIAQSERPTLREMAIAIGNGSAGGNIESCGPTPFLADVVERADLIVEGIVRTRASYLTDDGRDIFTDYDLSIRHLLFQREMLVSSRPGVAVPVIFKSHGGQVIVDGLRLVVNVQTNHARVTLTEGDHVYLFAARDRDDGKWRVRCRLVAMVDHCRCGGAIADDSALAERSSRCHAAGTRSGEDGPQRLARGSACTSTRVTPVSIHTLGCAADEVLRMYKKARSADNLADPDRTSP
jgi:hypothetical protein